MPYVDGFVVAVPEANKAEYRKHAAAAVAGKRMLYGGFQSILDK